MPLSGLPTPCPGSEALLYAAQISPFPCRPFPAAAWHRAILPSQPRAASASDSGRVWLVGSFTKVVATGKAVLERVSLREELDEGREGNTRATAKRNLEMGGWGEERLAETCGKEMVGEESGWRGFNRAGAAVSGPALPRGLCLPGYENRCCVKTLGCLLDPAIGPVFMS